MLAHPTKTVCVCQTSNLPIQSSFIQYEIMYLHKSIETFFFVDLDFIRKYERSTLI